MILCIRHVQGIRNRGEILTPITEIQDPKPQFYKYLP